MDDVQALIDSVKTKARQYCGREAIDCDYNNNVRELRFSVREHLFGHLRDIVGGPNGRVITRGEQFHNIITQPPYLKRRVRGVDLADQIEIPFGLHLNVTDRGGGETPRWLIDPLECNQILDPRGRSLHTSGLSVDGNVAVNVIGRNLSEGTESFNYQLSRGGVDYIRACAPESVVEEIGTSAVLDYPVRTRLTSYAPQSSQAAMESIPAFFSRSGTFSACLNEPNSAGTIGGLCWQFFARDRSLSAPDWKLVVPLFVGGGATDTAWVLGEGVSNEERPIIEDIVLHFRYRSRPVEE